MISKFEASLFAAVLLAPASGAALAQQKFDTPAAAATALVEAVRADDRSTLNAILGPGGSDITSSGDDVQDATISHLFLLAYDAAHEIRMTDDAHAVLRVGQQGFPVPIPIVKRNDTWQFDTQAGKEEMLFRRIGRNELNAIQVCLSYVDAQNEYLERMRASGAAPVYAQRFFSHPGKQDGLYWPAATGGDASPMGEFVARATFEGYRVGSRPQPYHGYYYKILTQQGPTAPGGAHNYIVKGEMIGGFALAAFPAEYGNSGVMTFVVNYTGAIFQKDLGARTKPLADRMTSFDPDHTWARVSETDLPQQ